MKRIFTLIAMLLVLVSSVSSCHREMDEPNVEVTDTVRPSFPGGLDRFRQLVANNFNVYAVKGEGKVKTTVVFVIEVDGSIAEVKATGPNESMNKEGEKAIKAIKEKWIPGRLNGKPVRNYLQVPIIIDFGTLATEYLL